jgi:hypothetical protein
VPILFPAAPGVTLEQLKAYVLAPRISGIIIIIMLLRFVCWASIPLPPSYSYGGSTLSAFPDGLAEDRY